MVKVVISKKTYPLQAVRGLVDLPSPDGTTAFDAAVGRLNADLVKLMLRSDVGGKEHMVRSLKYQRHFLNLRWK